MSKPLSSKMADVLSRLRDGKPQSSYDLRATLTTMRALEGRGLVTSKHGLGSMAFPQSSIMWRITNAGLRATLEGKAS